MPTPKPPYAAAFRQQMVELVRAGRLYAVSCGTRRRQLTTAAALNG